MSFALAVLSAVVVSTTSAVLPLRLEKDHVCGSDDVRVKVPFGADGIRSPLAGSTIDVSTRQNEFVSIGRVKPGLAVVTAHGKDGASGRLAVLALPSGQANCFELRVVKTREVAIDAAQLGAWTKYLEGFSKLSQKERDDVSARFKSSLGTVAISGGATFVSCAVTVGAAATGVGSVLLYACVGSIVDLAVSMASNYLQAVNEVLLTKKVLTQEESSRIKRIIQTVVAAESVVSTALTGSLDGQKLVKAMFSPGNALTAVSYSSSLALSDNASAAVGGGVDLTKKYLYVAEALSKAP